jgi:hypothetical protein
VYSDENTTRRPNLSDSKYGSPHRQIRALVILDGLIENGGGRFQRACSDEPLLERLRLLARDDGVDPQVRKKCKVLFIQWANAYKGKPGMERIASLYKEFPKSQRPDAARQKVLRDSEPLHPDAQPDASPFAESSGRPLASKPKPPPPSSPKPIAPVAAPSRPVALTNTSSSLSSKLFHSKKSSTSKTFNLSKEKDNMTTAIAQASIASTNLLNGLQLVNREQEKLSENAEVMRRFDACKLLRRKILYYIQHVESDKWIGSLVNANDELVKALTAFEIMDRSISDDSDSDIEDGGASTSPRENHANHINQDMAKLHMHEEAPPPPQPQRPMSIAVPPVPTFNKTPAKDEDGRSENEDDDDPFGDSNAVATPYGERAGMTWKEV